MKATFVSKKLEANDIYTFSFAIDTKPRYIAGQFIEMYLPHPNKDSRGNKRWFTLSSSPTEDTLMVSTRYDSLKASSFKQALFNLTAGDTVDMIAPMGDFVLPKDPRIPIFFVAGGIGCTPFRSMIKYIQDSSQKRDISMIYAARTKDDVAFKAIFSQLGKAFYMHTGKPLTAEIILSHTNLSTAKVSNPYYIYLSGPEPMIQSLRHDLIEANFPKKYIFSDYFPGYSQL